MHPPISNRVRAKNHCIKITTLIDVVSGPGVQLVTINRPSAYGEYAPYKTIDEEKEFEQKVLLLKN